MERLLPRHGGYRRLRSFQVAQAVYDATVVFCDRFIDRRSRTRDQMVQAARSGVQNIAEGSLASATSKKMEITLTNVAKASLGELLRDYEDYLRQGRWELWAKDSEKALEWRRRLEEEGPGVADFRKLPGDLAANVLVCLIHQASFLLRRQLERLEQDFLRQGGFSERMHALRARARRLSDQSDQSDQSDKVCCPRCGGAMRVRVVREGVGAGQRFWGCAGFPSCRGTRPMDQPKRPVT